MRAYLPDRLAAQAWTLAQVRGELGVALATRRLLEEQQVRRMAPTRQPRAAAAIGPNKQARAVHHHSDRPAPVFRAAGALVCLGRWLHRVPT